MIEINKIYNENCLQGMSRIDDKSVDLILCDLPFELTSCKWDIIIPFEPLWIQYKRIIKDNGAIVLTGNQPFTSMLIMSNLKWFKYEWIWKKTKGTGFLNAKKMPLNGHENILVFGNGKINYYPIKTYVLDSKIDKRKNMDTIHIKEGQVYNGSKKHTYIRTKDDGSRYPLSVQEFNNKHNFNIHPTQKPVKLFEYLIKTYTKENELVLDNCMGSGTTAIAALNTNRQYIGFELDEDYFNIAQERIKTHIKANELDIEGLF